jgi:DNA-binding HxlR family transcriptional regulator
LTKIILVIAGFSQKVRIVLAPDCIHRLLKATMKLQKETSLHGKWYDDACGTAYALELVGERWSLLIMREMMFGPRRFTDLRGGLPAISAKVLSERLEGLERAGIVQRRQLPPPAAAQVYELTPWGYQAEEAIQALGRWAARSPHHDPTLPLSAASLLMSFRTMFDPARAQGLGVTGSIRVGMEEFRVEVVGGQLLAERGAADAPDFGLAAPQASAIAGAVYGKLDFADLAGAGLEVSGDTAAALRFIDLFHLPAKAA